MYYNVECELSRHRPVITVWDRPGFAAKPPFTPSQPLYSLYSTPPHTGPDNERVITPPRRPTAVLLERESGRESRPPFQEEIIILFTRSAAAFSRRPDYDPFDSATLLPSAYTYTHIYTQQPRAMRVAYKDRIVSFRPATSSSAVLSVYFPLNLSLSHSSFFFAVLFLVHFHHFSI